jgi:hypothetical protein
LAWVATGALMQAASAIKNGDFTVLTGRPANLPV